MRFFLDNNAVIALMKGAPAFLTRMKRYTPQDFALPSIVAYELFYGADEGQRRQDNLVRIEALRFAVLEFDKEDARKAGELRATLAAAGMPIGPYDVLIAGQALARDLVVVTHNTRKFARVPGLRVEDWEV